MSAPGKGLDSAPPSEQRMGADRVKPADRRGGAGVTRSPAPQALEETEQAKRQTKLQDELPLLENNSAASERSLNSPPDSPRSANASFTTKKVAAGPGLPKEQEDPSSGSNSPDSPVHTKEENEEETPDKKSLEASIAAVWWPGYQWEQATELLRVQEHDSKDERQLLRAPLEAFFVLQLPSASTALHKFPLIKARDSRVWDGQLLRRMQVIFPSLGASKEGWLTSVPEWKLLASVLFFMASCKSWQRQAPARVRGGSGGAPAGLADGRSAYFSSCLGISEQLFRVERDEVEKKIQTSPSDMRSFFSQTLLELRAQDKAWHVRLRQSVNRRYRAGLDKPEDDVEVLSFLRVAFRGFQFVQNPLTAAHEALVYHPALACLTGTVATPKIFPRASPKSSQGCVEWFVEEDSSLLVLCFNQSVGAGEALRWSASRFLPFDAQNACWNASVTSKVEETESEQTHESRLLLLSLLFQRCRLSLFKPYHSLDAFIENEEEHAFVEETTRQLVAYALDPQNMDLLRCKVPSLGTEVVSEGLFASLYLRCCLYACFAVWVHRQGVPHILLEVLRHHPTFASRWKGVTRKMRKEVRQELSRTRSFANGKIQGGEASRKHSSTIARHKTDGGSLPGGLVDIGFLSDALLFLLENQFTELCFLVFPPQGSYLSDLLGSDVLLKFARLAGDCRELRLQNLLGREGRGPEGDRKSTGSTGCRTLLEEEVRESLLARSDGESVSGEGDAPGGGGRNTRHFARWGI